MMVKCCQKASLFQEWVLKAQTLLEKFLHPRFPVADSQEKAVIEWCSNRNNLGCCCKRTQNKEIPGLLQFWSLHLLHMPGTHLCVEWGFSESYLESFCSFLDPFCVSLLWLWHVWPSQGWSLAVPGSSWAGQEPQGGDVAPALGRDLPAAPLSSAAQRPWNNLVFPVPKQKLELLLFSFCWHQPRELLSVFR